MKDESKKNRRNGIISLPILFSSSLFSVFLKMKFYQFWKWGRQKWFVTLYFAFIEKEYLSYVFKYFSTGIKKWKILIKRFPRWEEIKKRSCRKKKGTEEGKYSFFSQNVGDIFFFFFLLAAKKMLKGFETIWDVAFLPTANKNTTCQVSLFFNGLSKPFSME